MSEQNGFGFCPKCGAVMQNGVCQSCGYGRRLGNWQQESQNQNQNANWQQSQGQNVNWQQGPQIQPVKRPGRSTGEKVVIGICIGIGVLFMVAIIVFLVFTTREIFRRAASSYEQPDYGYDSDDGYFGYGTPYDDSWYDEDDGYYVPDEEDEYYVEITDATSLDLSYGVSWQNISINPDDPDDECTYNCVYPVLTGENEHLASMNQVIEDLICEFKGSYQDYASGVGSYGYVTYMDEEKISVVVRHSLYEKKSVTPLIRAVTFRLDTGEVISHADMTEVDTELVWQFRTRNSIQNGDVEIVDELTDEELQEYLQSEENSVMFYSPVGLEVGFNYDGGWVTVTLKDSML